MNDRATKFDCFDFERQLADALDADCLLPSGAKVLVGVSGGADSVAMLVAMHSLARRGRNFELVVAHLDHGLRAESSADAEFVAELSANLGVECFIARQDVASLAQQLGEGLEQAARLARFEFFRDTAQQCQAQAIALGHHADDNAETILFRILRGTAWRGLAGISAYRQDGQLRIIRPLLGFRRAEILDYCRSRDLSWREDATNAETIHRRNFIRNELLPLIRDRINPQVDEALLRLGSLAGETERFLHSQAREAMENSVVLAEGGKMIIDAKMLAAYSLVVRTTAYRLALTELGMPQRNLTAEHLTNIDALLQASSGVVNLPANFAARRERSHLLIGRENSKKRTTDAHR